jgi:hypothetical protein
MLADSTAAATASVSVMRQIRRMLRQTWRIGG